MRYATALTIAVALLAAACGKNDTADPTDTPGATLIVSPTVVEVTETSPDTTVFLSTDPSGGRLQWQVSAKPEWLTVTPDRGVIQGITPVKLTATATPTMEPGSTFGHLELIASGGKATVQIELRLPANPLLSLSASTISINAATDTATIVLSNPGRGGTNWSVTGQPAWLTFIPAGGYIATGASQTVRIVPNRTPLPAGTATSTVVFRNDNTTTTASVAVSVAVAPAPRAAVAISRLVFYQAERTRTLTIANPGKGSLAWQSAASDPGLKLTPSSGTIAAGDSQSVIVTTSGGIGSAASFTVSSNAVDYPSLRVDVLVLAAPPAAGVTVLDHHVIDAEFDRSSGVLVTVSADPDRLNAIDTETGDSWSVALPKDPCCVAIRPDGRFAAVAHDAAVSYVDLVSRQLVKTYATTSDAFDVVLPSNGYVYVWPRTDQWVNVHAVNLTTEAEENGADLIYAGSHAKLHPSGRFAYDIWFLSPADLEKFDLTGGRAVRTADSPYHGDHPMGYNLWFSPSGDRILTEQGTLFRSSTSPVDDMRYMGRLPNVNGARMLAEDPARQRIYGFATASGGFAGVDPALRTGEILVFDSRNLNALAPVPLPKVDTDGAQVDVDGHFLFPSLDGRRLFMLVKAAYGSTVTHDWALYIVDATKLP